MGKIYDRSLNKSKGADVSLSALALLFAEFINVSKEKVQGISELEDRISDLGKVVGIRLYELAQWREKSSKRETQFLNILFSITNGLWKTACGKHADSLERSTERENEFMVCDNDPLIAKFISTPKELQPLNCAVFYGGMIEAVLSANGFDSKVSAHFVPLPEFPNRTVYLIKLAEPPGGIAASPPA